MSFITAQQTKLDLEPVPNENRLDIKKCNGRIPCGLTLREPTFQVVLDTITLTSCYPAFLITADIPEVYMHQDIFQICPRVPGRDFDALPSEEDAVSFLREIGHTWEINSLNDIEKGVYKKQENMYYPRFMKAIIHHFLIQDKTLSWRNKIRMHTYKDDYLISTLRFISTKESTQIYEAILPECLTSPAMKESKAYKNYLGYAMGAVPPKIARKFKKTSPSKKAKPTVETKSKRKEKVDVTHGEGIELLSKVALTEEAQMKEIRKKSLRDFHKLHPSGSGIVAKKPPRVEKITPIVTSEGTGDKPEKIKAMTMRTKSDDDKTPSDSEKDSDSKQDTDGSESNSKTDQQEYQEEVKDDDDDDKSEGDEDKGMDSDDVQDNKVDVEMIDVQQEKENLNITQEQVVKDAHVTIMTIAKETKVPDASDVAELKKDPLHTQVTALVDDHLDTRMGATGEEFINFLSASLTDKITKQVRNQLPQILLEEVSNFALPVIKKMITESLNQDKHEGPFAGSDRRLKKRKTRKDAEPTTSPKNKDSPSRSSKGTKSQPKSSGKFVHAEEPEFKINVTKPDTTRPDLRKRHPYTPYKDPQGFIYVDDYQRNRLMRSDKLYKFSDGTLNKLFSLLEDITKNIDMEYLPKRRWSKLEKKIAHFMIKDINKLLKERRMMRSLEKFVGGRLYETNLSLLQRTI
nr:hypothetical protein [Tanacetum cinerariifolium]